LLWEVLSDEFVHVLVGPQLPRRVPVHAEKELNSIDRGVP
jgi:hypothetical protein